MADIPKMTYYSRVLDNITNEPITAWSDAHKSTLWYYGRCNGKDGGESEYLVEFDIWNNEPSFNAGMYDDHCSDATDCRLTVMPDSTVNSNKLFLMTSPFMYARATTFGYKDKFMPIRNNIMLEGITGNVNASINGVIQGVGDHAIIQTKIVLPANTFLDHNTRYSFDFVFYYDFV